MKIRLNTPLKGKYLVRNRLANKALAWTDLFLSLFPRKKPPAPQRPKNILISNLAHMGDVVIMTSILQVLRKNYPEASIGVLIGSWSLPILKNHPYVDRVHIVDHWKLNRATISRSEKLIRYNKTKRNAIREIKRSGYDVAIDAYYHFPNAIPIFWRSRIPVRIGYTSGGFGPLLTHAVDWANRNEPAAHYYFDLLNFLGISRESSLSLLHPNLPRSTISGSQYILQNYKCDLSKGYIVIHIGTGSSLKEWPVNKWRELVEKLKGYPLIFTGKGANEREKIDCIIHQIEGCINLADVLPWEVFISLIQDARLLIGVDSVPGHIAAAFNAPSVLIFSGMTNIHHWAPMNKQCTIITHQVPCAPCYKSQGCSAMSCVQEASVEAVYQACVKRLEPYCSCI